MPLEKSPFFNPPLSTWQLTSSQVFWGEVAHADHVVQIYDNELVFLDTLAGFVGTGINEGDSIILLATNEHLFDLEERLTGFGVHLDSLIADDRYIALDAGKALDSFMVKGSPDPDLFKQTIGPVVKKAQKKGREVIAFGEMVAILWTEGNKTGAIQLEKLWNEFLKENTISLFCAYPRSGFSNDPSNGLQDVCTCHTKMISGSLGSMEHVYYKSVASH
jgi:hypothetical protein